MHDIFTEARKAEFAVRKKTLVVILCLKISKEKRTKEGGGRGL